MSKKQEQTAQSPQLALFDELLEALEKGTPISTSGYMAEALKELKKAQAQAAQREVSQSRRKKEEERQRKEQAARKKQEERVRQITSMDLPMDWENLFDSDPRTQGVHADSIQDGLLLSLSNLEKVDIEYISAITGEDMKTVIRTLRGSIYQNPETWEECFYKGWETADEYLSGNMVRKWKVAREADQKYNGYFADNVKAISKVLPQSVSSEDIYITLGSPWIPTDIIDEFATHILRLTGLGYYGTKHDEHTGTWELPDKSFYKDRVAARSTYGTERMTALYILERTLNMKTVCVTDEVACSTNKSGKKRVLNQQETVAALEKQQKMIQEFQRWVWRDSTRKTRLEMIFENNFGCVRRRHFDGSFLTYPNMSPQIQMRPYQNNAVARILFSPNTLLAHDVGSGKTYIMIAAGMELLRTGKSKKNLYVVPNNLVGQWKSIFLQLYPAAKVFCVEPKNFKPEKREKTLETIRDGEFDGIIMAYSCFEQIGLSQEYYLKTLEQTREEIKKLLSVSAKATTRLRQQEEAVKKAIFETVTNAVKNGSTIYFDELGITRLFVDEAHNFKNVPIDTKTDRVLGISAVGSKKCRDMMDKVRMIQKQNNGGGVVMATGTPITNSITDAYVMQKYLQSGELAMLDLQSFDSWVGMFAERVTEFEVDVDTSSYRLATRFSKFHNLPELTALLSSVADFHMMDSADGVPQLDGYTDSLLGKTPEFEEYLQTISARAEEVRAGRISRTEDNMLKITTDGRKAALDLRLVNPDAGFTYQSKVVRCAENVYSIYRNTAARKSTQLIFCDSSTPKKGFNVYDEVKALLTGVGIPEEQIAFIHSADTEARRQALFAKVRSGEIRILMGSTFKLGLGVNVQDKLVAIHHLDVPWRPADMTQREGRILRQGNENEKVQIFRYITEGSFDAYSWQLLETKQRFITGLLSGAMEARSGSDIEDTVLNYAEVKALAVGNPLVKQRVETANDLSRLLTLQKKAVDNHIKLEKELMEIPGLISHMQQLIGNCEADAAFCAETFRKQDAETRRGLRKVIFDAVAANELATKESCLMQYQGFDIILPANMIREKPYVWLRRQGKYYTELGDSETGCLVRVDNVLEGLPDHQKKLEKNLQELRQRQTALQKELLKKEDYTDKIAACQRRLAKLDKLLGVEQ